MGLVVWGLMVSVVGVEAGLVVKRRWFVEGAAEATVGVEAV